MPDAVSIPDCAVEAGAAPLRDSHYSAISEHADGLARAVLLAASRPITCPRCKGERFDHPTRGPCSLYNAAGVLFVLIQREGER